MATTPYPLPRSARRTSVMTGDGGANYGPFGSGWGIFDTADVDVWVKAADAITFSRVSATITKSSSDPYDTFSINVPGGIPNTSSFYVEGARVHERSVGVTRGGALSADALELEFSKIAVVLQEARRDGDDADAVEARVAAVEDAIAHKVLKISDSDTTQDINDLPLAAARANQLLGFDGNGEPRTFPYPAGAADGVTTPEQFGGVAGGTADARAAILQALATGNMVDLRYQTFGVAGRIDMLTGQKIKNGTLRQLAPAASQSVVTLQAVSQNSITIDNIKIDRNGDGTNSGANTGPNGAINTAFGAVINGGKHHVISRLEVYGNDSGTGIWLVNLDHTSLVYRPYVHDIFGVISTFTSSPRSGDDQVQGINITQCSNLRVIEPRVERIGWKKNIGDPVEYVFSRGIPLNGNRGVILENPTVDTMDQGIDWTGDGNGGNWDCQSINPRALHCTTWGHKAANLQKRMQVRGGYAEDCGYAGFVEKSCFHVVEWDGQTGAINVGDTVTGQTSGATGVVFELYDAGTSGYCVLVNEAPIQFIDNENLRVGGVTKAIVNMPAGWLSPAITMKDANRYYGCIARNCGIPTGTTGGFICLYDSNRNSAVGVIFDGCHAFDDRSPRQMQLAFFNEVPPTPVSYVIARNCIGEGYTSASDGPFRGMVAQDDGIHISDLRSTYTLGAGTGMKNIFPSGQDEFFAEANSVYDFDLSVFLGNMAASAGDFSFQFGGTASLTGRYQAQAAKLASVSPSGLHSPEHLVSDVLTSRTLVTSNSQIAGYALIRGQLRTGSAPGTIIPQVSVSVSSASLAALQGTRFRAWKAGTAVATNNADKIMGAFG